MIRNLLKTILKFLVPRRFNSFYWNANDILVSVRRWQWGNHCFRTRTRKIIRSYGSPWPTLLLRVKHDDVDALLIVKLSEDIAALRGGKASELYIEACTWAHDQVINNK